MFGESYTEWNYITRYCDASWINTYSCSRDTLMDEESYKIIDGLGYVKESSENEKLWLRRTPMDSALLIFDLSLSTGDSFFLGSRHWIVDSIFALNGLRVVEFETIPPHCGPEDVPVRFVEGLGPNFDFQYFLTDWEEEYANLIRCHTKDSAISQYMPFYGDGDCTYAGPTNTDEHHSQDASDVPAPFPNPVRDFLQVAHIPFEYYNLYDINGKKVLSGGPQKEIDMRSLRKGIYFLKLYSKGSKVYTHKILKQ